MKTGLFDADEVEITAGDKVSLEGYFTADNSMGVLPNGYFFDDTDVYEVYFDERIQNWSLKIETDMNSTLEVHFLNHAVSCLHSGDVKIVK